MPWRSWGQHGAHLGPTGPRWAPCWPHEPCYLGNLEDVLFLSFILLTSSALTLYDKYQLAIWLPNFPSTLYMTELKLSYSYSHSYWTVAVLCAIVPALMDHLAPPYKVWIIYEIQHILLLKELLEICLFYIFCIATYGCAACEAKCVWYNGVQGSLQLPRGHTKFAFCGVLLWCNTDFARVFGHNSWVNIYSLKAPLTQR